MIKKLWLSLLAVALVGFSGCSKDDKPEKPTDGKFSGAWLSSPELIDNGYTVVDENQKPISTARVLIGNRQNDPFPGNYISVNEKGQFEIPQAWNTPQNLTIDATGYMRVTFMEESPHPRMITLKKLELAPQYSLKGVTSGLPIQDRDGFVDFSLVMSTMTKYDILNFDLNKVISSQTDRISAVGQDIDIPSNISLPRQKENYIIGITLEKPEYKLNFNELGVKRIYAARGRFLFKDVVDQLRDGTDFFELINYFNISGGTLKDILLTGPTTSLDLNVNDMNYTKKMNVVVPKIAQDQVEIAASIVDMNGTLFLSDVKRLTSGQKAGLAVLPNADLKVAHILKNSAEFDPAKPGSDRLSGTIVPFSEGSQALYIPLIKNPTRLGDYSYKFDPPAAPQGVNPLASYSVISDVIVSTDAQGYKVKTAIRMWEIYNKKWVSQLDLPQWGQSFTGSKKRVEVSFIGSLNTQDVELGNQVVEAATHLSKSSLEF